MTRLVKRKRSRKKLSEFQKLWAKAGKLENENARFRARLDEIMERIRTDIQPVEEEFAKLMIWTPPTSALSNAREVFSAK